MRTPTAIAVDDLDASTITTAGPTAVRGTFLGVGPEAPRAGRPAAAPAITYPVNVRPELEEDLEQRTAPHGDPLLEAIRA